jgi:hypothetical protein
MKTNLLKSVVLVASLLGALGSASAETVHARIPFGFTAAGTAMPAGAYVIRTMPSSPSVLVFENEDTKVQTIVFARMELRNMAADGWTYELRIPSARTSLKGVALTLKSSGR